MIERTADALDQACQRQDEINEEGLAAVRAQLRPQEHPDFNGADCVDCGDPLPAVRLAYKWFRCAPCQGEIEQRLKMQGRR